MITGSFVNDKGKKMDNLDSLVADLLEKVNSATSLQSLDEIRVNALGKKGILTEQMKTMGAMQPEERKIVGQALNVA